MTTMAFPKRFVDHPPQLASGGSTKEERRLLGFGPCFLSLGAGAALTLVARLADLDTGLDPPPTTPDPKPIPNLRHSTGDARPPPANLICESNEGLFRGISSWI